MKTSLPALCLALATAASSAFAQGDPEGLPREQMWRAPTAEEWEKPVLITFQRTWEDAVAVAQETKKPILICVNMDGEIASEHYAGVRYRDPEIAALYEPYVCVIASVYRHNPRDHDEHGNRILCPRFGSVTCGEHIAIEPQLYEKYFEGERVAPRHIMVELDGEETYDVYYAFDTASVFSRIKEGIAERDIETQTIVRGDRPIVERVASRHIVDRIAVEDAYREGDEEVRRRLLEAALQNTDAAPDGLLRLGVFGLDAELADVARDALAKTDAASSVDLIADALAAPMDEGDRQALVEALGRLANESPRARTLAVVHRGLGTRSKDVDVDGWASAIQGGASYAAPENWESVESKVESSSERAAADPKDAEAKLALAESSLELAVDPKTTEILAANPRTAGKYSRLMFEDARRAALEAEELGATGWRLDAVLGLCAYYLGDLETAYARAEAAAPSIPSGAQEWSAIATLALFAQARQKDIAEAVREKADWPGEWLTDVDAAYTVLAEHPLGTDGHAAAHYDVMKALGAGARAARVLEAGLERFPESWVLHDRLRERILEEKGVDGLESTYAELLASPDAAPNLPWFAAYASIVAAEFHRRRGRDDAALAAYDRAIERYEEFIAANPEARDSSDHYVAVALAGRARIAMENGDLEGAVDQVIASFERDPEAASARDGLNLSAVDTAKTLLARLRESERTELATRVDAALSSLDPRHLELPAFERGGPRPQGGRRRPR